MVCLRVVLAEVLHWAGSVQRLEMPSHGFRSSRLVLTISEEPLHDPCAIRKRRALASGSLLSVFRCNVHSLPLGRSPMLRWGKAGFTATAFVMMLGSGLDIGHRNLDLASHADRLADHPCLGLHRQEECAYLNWACGGFLTREVVPPSSPCFGNGWLNETVFL